MPFWSDLWGLVWREMLGSLSEGDGVYILERMREFFCSAYATGSGVLVRIRLPTCMMHGCSQRASLYSVE